MEASSGTKRSFVHDYFETVESENKEGDSVNKKKCKKCHFVCTPKSGSTSSMQFHLLHSHGISKASVQRSERKEKGQDSGYKTIVKQTSISSFCASKNRSVEEWCTRQVVLDGLTLRQLAQSEFQEAACFAMRMKHFKSHVTVGKVVMNYIKEMISDTRNRLTEKFKEGSHGQLNFLVTKFSLLIVTFY
jgi:hypothetical protein